MMDKVIYWLRWSCGTAVSMTLGIWIVAVIFALAGFRVTAENINWVVLRLLPVDAALMIAMLVSILIRWLVAPGHAARK
jgi:hypothetical protein